jgi:hypothetical protein
MRRLQQESYYTATRLAGVVHIVLSKLAIHPAFVVFLARS